MPQKLPETNSNTARASNADLLTSGRLMNASITESYLGVTSIGLRELMESIDRQAEAVCRGDLRGIEAMLVGQAISMQRLFNDLAIRFEPQLETHQTLLLLASAIICSRFY